MEVLKELAITRRNLLIASAATVATASVVPTARAQSSGAEVPPSSPLSFSVNGERRELEVDNRTTLLDALREHLHLTGTKKGCDHGQCGACT